MNSFITSFEENWKFSLTCRICREVFVLYKILCSVQIQNSLNNERGWECTIGRKFCLSLKPFPLGMYTNEILVCTIKYMYERFNLQFFGIFIRIYDLFKYSLNFANILFFKFLDFFFIFAHNLIIKHKSFLLECSVIHEVCFLQICIH